MSYTFDFSLAELAVYLGGQVIGDEDYRVKRIKTLEYAESDDLSFFINARYKAMLADTSAGAILISETDQHLLSTRGIVVADPRLALTKLTRRLEQEHQSAQRGIHPSAVIGQDCTISPDSYIGPGCILGDKVTLAPHVILQANCVLGDNVSIEQNTTLCANVVVEAQVKIGASCTLFSGAVIGSDGFGYAKEEGRWLRTPQLGSVEIGNHVEIGAHTAIDRGFLEDTVISEGVIIDNLVQVGHNVSIGAHTAIAGCVAIAGSTKIGQHCLIGGGTSIGGHLTIVDNVIITATSAVNRSLLKAGQYSSSFPAKPSESWRKNAARFSFLDQMAKRLKQIEKKIAHD